MPRSVQDPLTSNATNVTGTLNVLLAARDAGVRRVVYASSSSIYGANPELPKHEGLLPQPISPYAVAKLAGEGFCRSFHEVFGLETVALRYFNVFGPRQDPLSQYAAVVPNFITALLDGDQPVVFGDGEQSRDFTYVGNVVEGNVLAMTAEGVAGKPYNLAAGDRTTLNELLGHIGRLTGKPAEARYEATAARGREALAGRRERRRARPRLPAEGFRRGGPRAHPRLVQRLNRPIRNAPCSGSMRAARRARPAAASG